MKVSTRIITYFCIAMGTLAAHSAQAQTGPVGEDASSGEVIGEVVVSSSKELASGVAIATNATADTLDGLTWAGCSMAKWAVGESRDRKPSIGNTVVGLVFRLPVTLTGGAVCAASSLLAMPTKGITYGLESLSAE